MNIEWDRVTRYSKLRAVLVIIIIALGFYLWNEYQDIQSLTQLPAKLQDSELLVLHANQAFDEGQKETAKELYIKAAQAGNAEAHFQLRYRFLLPAGEGTYHVIEAAKKGHEKALDFALDDLFLRAQSTRNAEANLKKADLSLALKVYEQAKQANPSLELFQEQATIETLQNCLEPADFDIESFMKTYNVGNDELPWDLAEEASRGGRFGNPDPELVLNLICRGGFVPAELIYAVGDTYKNWKNGTVEEFNGCSYAAGNTSLRSCGYEIPYR